MVERRAAGAVHLGNQGPRSIYRAESFFTVSTPLAQKTNLFSQQEASVRRILPPPSLARTSRSLAVPTPLPLRVSLAILQQLQALEVAVEGLGATPVLDLERPVIQGQPSTLAVRRTNLRLALI